VATGWICERSLGGLWQRDGSSCMLLKACNCFGEGLELYVDFSHVVIHMADFEVLAIS
jgi:hypothetical protein